VGWRYGVSLLNGTSPSRRWEQKPCGSVAHRPPSRSIPVRPITWSLEGQPGRTQLDGQCHSKSAKKRLQVPEASDTSWYPTSGGSFLMKPLVETELLEAASSFALTCIYHTTLVPSPWMGVKWMILFCGTYRRLTNHSLPATPIPSSPNCYPVIIDYLLRKGHVSPDVPGYLDVLRELRSAGVQSDNVL
jgi:hypothetical protein